MTWNPLGTLLLLPRLCLVRTGRGLVFRVLTFISVISYAMYLLNLTPIQGRLLRVTDDLLGLRDRQDTLALVVRYILYWTLTVGLAYLMYRFYERPMTMLRERLRS